jgi:cytochrome c
MNALSNAGRRKAHAMLGLGLLCCALAARAGGDPQAGQRAFRKLCASCHQVGPSAGAAFGPQLNGIFGRRAGTTPDYSYSNAMKNSGLVWDEANLRRFLKSPDALVPGTRMRFWGLGLDDKLDDLLAYLCSVPQGQ